MSTDTPQSTLSSPHLWREGEVLVVERNQPLPDVCWLSGEPATRRIACLFHWSAERFAPTHGELVMVLEGIRYYFADVQKARIDVPLADDLCRKRVAGWINFALAGVFVVATIVGLLLGQAWIDGLPKGPQRQELNMWLPPAIALGGFALISIFACLCYYRMPMPTARLKPTRITETHVWLSGAAPSLLARLDDADEPEWAIEEEEGDTHEHS